MNRVIRTCLWIARTGTMAPFPAAKLALLERLISNGDMDGIGAAKAKKRWPEDFGSIATKTLNNKIRTVRQNFVNAQILKGISCFFICIC